MHTVGRPIPILLALFCLGICLEQAICQWEQQLFPVCLIVFLAASLSLVASFLWHRNSIATLSILVLSFTAGLIRMSWDDMQLQQPTAGKSGYVEGVISSTPVSRPNNTSFLFHTTSGHNAAVTIWRDSTLVNNDPKLGDIVRIKARIQKPTRHGNPDEFNYARWLRVQNIHGVIHAETANILHPSDKHAIDEQIPQLLKLRIRALQWREAMLSRLNAHNMSASTKAILAAVALGDRSSINAEIRDLYSEAGASHLMALSGLHLGIVMAFFMWFARRRMHLPFWRVPLCTIMIASTWAFALLVGLPSSLVRASLMTTVWIVAMALNRHNSAFHNLLMAAFIMLLWHPAYLFDVGAQLSCAAVGGILLGTELWQSSRRSWLMWFVNLFAISLFAQMATMPLTVYYFQTVSPYAALFNMLYVPCTMLLVYGTILLLLLSVVWASGAVVVASALSLLVAMQTHVMRFQTQLPGATQTVSLYQKAQPQLIIYHNRACPALHFVRHHDESYLLMPHPELQSSGLQSIRRTFWKRRLTAEPIVIHNKENIVIGDKHISMVYRNSQQLPPKTTDILWLCKGYYGSLHKLCRQRTVKLIILDASLSNRLRSQFVKEARELGIACYDITQQGALRLQLRVVQEYKKY